MSDNAPTGVGGWLLAYLIGSIPLLAVYSMGLSGWFLDYPLVLTAAIFAVFALPLLLILLRSPAAPAWNIAMMWVAATLMLLRSIAVVTMPSGVWDPMGPAEAVGVAGILAAIVGVALAWAAVWTGCFRRSVRVANTFTRGERD